jgi:phage I-like protein
MRSRFPACRSMVLQRICLKAICDVSQSTGDNTQDVETFEDEIELHNPQVALQMLGKYHETFVDKLKIEVTWQDAAVAMIQQDELTYASALEVFDHDEALIKELFAKARMPINPPQLEG